MTNKNNQNSQTFFPFLSETDSTMTTKKKPHRLSHLQSYDCINWLRAHRDVTLEKERLTFLEAAEKMSQDLGFLVQPSNVQNLANSLKMSWSRRKVQSPKSRSSKNTNSSGSNISALSRYLRILYIAMVDIDPQGLKDISNKAKISQLFTEEETAKLLEQMPVDKIRQFLE